MDTLGSISSRAEVGWYERCANTDQEQFGILAVAMETPFSPVHKALRVRPAIERMNEWIRVSQKAVFAGKGPRHARQ